MRMCKETRTHLNKHYIPEDPAAPVTSSLDVLSTPSVVDHINALLIRVDVNENPLLLI